MSHENLFYTGSATRGVSLRQHSVEPDRHTGAARPWQRRARRLRHLVLGLGTLAVASILAGTVFSVWRVHDEVIRLGEENLLSLARILAEQTLRSTHTVDAILHSAADNAQRGGARDALAPSVALQQQLREIIAHTPYVNALIVSDASGKLLLDTAQLPPRPIHYDVSEFFRPHRDDQWTPARPSPLVIGRMDGERSIMVSRGLNAANGAFLGVITAIVDPAYFLGPFGLPELGAHGAVRLLRRDGVLLTGYPAAIAAETRNYRDSVLLTQGVEAERGLIHHAGTAVPGERISAIRAVDGYPLVVTVTSSLDFVLRNWYRNAALFGVIAAVTAVLLGLITFSLAHQLRVDEELRSIVVESEERLQAIIQSAMDAIIIIDADQRIALFNAAAEQIFHCPSAEAMGTDIGRFVRGHLLLQPYAVDSAPMRKMAQHLALNGVRADGAEFPIDASLSQVHLHGTNLFIVILRDVTERKQVEAALRESEEQHRTILRTAMDGFWLVDTQGRLLEVNETYCRMSGYSAQELLTMTIPDLEAQEAVDDTAAHIQRIMTQGNDRFESRHRRKDGSSFDVEVGVQYRSIDGGRFVVFLQDITERKRAEQELKRSQQELRGLSKAANEALEAERRRTARELHDELGQALTALKMDLESLRSALPPDQSELEERTRAMHALLDSTIAATRRIAADLRPLMLDDLGLAAALDWLTHNFSKHTGIATDLVIDDSVAQVAEPIASALYRITQESLTNVAKYAQATKAEVRLEGDGDWVELTVRDNGRGIEASDQDKRGAFGLLGIRERVTLLGGEVAIKGEPGGGSEVSARIPLAAAGAAQPVA
jgi:PAS domain S-box-containing protein